MSPSSFTHHTTHTTPGGCKSLYKLEQAQNAGAAAVALIELSGDAGALSGGGDSSTNPSKTTKTVAITIPVVRFTGSKTGQLQVAGFIL